MTECLKCDCGSMSDSTAAAIVLFPGACIILILMLYCMTIIYEKVKEIQSK